MIKYALALNIIDLIIFEVILMKTHSKADDRIHDGIYLEPIEEETNEHLIKNMFLL